jgi:putative transmembrane protein PGPGW
MKWPSKVSTLFGWNYVPRPLRKLIVGLIGGTVLLIGVALIVLPGPAFLVIPIGLTILATEFAWAQRMGTRAREMFAKARRRKRGPEPVSP